MSMSAADIGVELCALVYHLYRSRRDATAAVAELTLRTRTRASSAYISNNESNNKNNDKTTDERVGRGSDCVRVPSHPSQLRQTAWCATMRRRYARVRAHVCAAHAHDIADAAALVRELYATGCAASDVADAVQTCVAMFTTPTTIPRARVQRCLDACTRRLAERRACALSADELVQLLVDSLLVDTLLPPRWWTHDDDDDVVASRVTRVALRAQPSEMVIEYVRTCKHDNNNNNNSNNNSSSSNSGDDDNKRATSRRRCRRVRVDARALVSGAPTAALARQLAVSHDALLPEATLQQLLLKLQRLVSGHTTTPATTMATTMTTATPAAAARGNGDVHSSDRHDTTMHAHNSNDNNNSHNDNDNSSSHNGSHRVGYDDATADRRAVRKADVGLLYRDPAAALDNVDLNDADELTLREFKAAMDVAFRARALRPGDDGYVYDKRVDVAPPTQHSEWDDDDDDDD